MKYHQDTEWKWRRRCEGCERRILQVLWRREICIDIWFITFIGNMAWRSETVLLLTKFIDIVNNVLQFLLCLYILGYFVWYTKIRETWRRFIIVESLIRCNPNSRMLRCGVLVLNYVQIFNLTKVAGFIPLLRMEGIFYFSIGSFDWYVASRAFRTYLTMNNFGWRLFFIGGGPSSQKMMSRTWATSSAELCFSSRSITYSVKWSW